MPVLGSNKRKREDQSETKHEASKPEAKSQAPSVSLGDENGPVKSSADEQEARDLKRARKKEKTNRLKDEADIGERERDKVEQKEGKSAILETKKKKKKSKADAVEPGDNQTVESASQGSRGKLESQDGDDEKKKKKEKKRKREKKRTNKDVSAFQANESPVEEDTRNIDGEEQIKKGTRRGLKVDDEAKGGVEPFVDDTFEPREQSADQNNQQRKHDVTSDNDWLRAKTSRLLDLMDEALQNPRSIPAELAEPSNDITVNEETNHIEESRPSSSDLPTTSASTGSSPSGRLFLRNLPYTIERADVEGLFSKYGRLDEVRNALR
jgi:hypothetical protein